MQMSRVTRLDACQMVKRTGFIWDDKVRAG